MYRSTKKKYVKRMRISAAVTVGALAAGAGLASVAGASTSPLKVTIGAVTSHDDRARLGAGAGRPFGAGGVVTALSSSSITVSGPASSTSTFAISSSTTFTKERASASVSQVVVGDRVRITPTSTGSSAAANIDVELPSLMGKVTAVNGDAISITGPNGVSNEVIVSSTTSYTKSGASVGLTDVTVGSSIFAEGNFASGSTTTLDATSVGLGMPRHQGFHGGPGPLGSDPSGTGTASGPALLPAD